MICILIMTLAAGLAAHFHIFTPLLDAAVEAGARNAFTNDPKISKVVLAVLAGIAAPLTLVILLVPNFKEGFTAALGKLFNE